MKQNVITLTLISVQSLWPSFLVFFLSVLRHTITLAPTPRTLWHQLRACFMMASGETERCLNILKVTLLALCCCETGIGLNLN